VEAAAGDAASVAPDRHLPVRAERDRLIDREALERRLRRPDRGDLSAAVGVDDHDRALAAGVHARAVECDVYRAVAESREPAGERAEVDGAVAQRCQAVL
jgi:hypothetical protein